MAKGYLHKYGEESIVLEIDGEEYNKSLDNGWTQARQIEAPIEEDIDLSDMTATQLKEVAEGMGITLPKKITKPKIINAITEAQNEI